MTDIIIKKAENESPDAALRLVWEVFSEYEAPDYSDEGIDEFYKSIHDPEYLASLTFYTALIKEKIVGVLATRSNGAHIALFFVSGEYQRRGIGRLLFNEAKSHNPARFMTVNSSPFAVPVYHKLGFYDTGSEQTVNGLRFTPMKRVCASASKPGTFREAENIAPDSRLLTLINEGDALITDRLIILPLSARRLKMLCFDIAALEKELFISYRATPLDGFFLEILKGQLTATENDSINYKYHSFWLMIKKDDRTVVGMADFKDVPNQNGEIEIGYGLGDGFCKSGYMIETVNALLNWAFSQDGVKAVIAETENDGFDSQSILINCGFEKYLENDTTWWRLLK